MVNLWQWLNIFHNFEISHYQTKCLDYWTHSFQSIFSADLFFNLSKGYKLYDPLPHQKKKNNKQTSVLSPLKSLCPSIQFFFIIVLMKRPPSHFSLFCMYCILKEGCRIDLPKTCGIKKKMNEINNHGIMITVIKCFTFRWYLGFVQYEN